MIDENSRKKLISYSIIEGGEPVLRSGEVELCFAHGMKKYIVYTSKELDTNELNGDQPLKTRVAEIKTTKNGDIKNHVLSDISDPKVEQVILNIINNIVRDETKELPVGIDIINTDEYFKLSSIKNGNIKDNTIEEDEINKPKDRPVPLKYLIIMKKIYLKAIDLKMANIIKLANKEGNLFNNIIINKNINDIDKLKEKINNIDEQFGDSKEVLQERLDNLNLQKEKIPEFETTGLASVDAALSKPNAILNKEIEKTEKTLSMLSPSVDLTKANEKLEKSLDQYDTKIDRSIGVPDLVNERLSIIEEDVSDFKNQIKDNIGNAFNNFTLKIVEKFKMYDILKSDYEDLKTETSIVVSTSKQVITDLEAKNKEKEEIILTKDQEIADLKAKLRDKESTNGVLSNELITARSLLEESLGNNENSVGETQNQR